MAESSEGHLALELTPEVQRALRAARGAVQALEAAGVSVQGLDVACPTFASRGGDAAQRPVALQPYGVAFLTEDAPEDDDACIGDSGVRVFADSFRLIAWQDFNERRVTSDEVAFAALGREWLHFHGGGAA